jgi:hypothetical protein
MYHPFRLSVGLALGRARTERLLSLPLLVLRIATADHPHHSSAPNDLAVFTDPLYA